MRDGESIGQYRILGELGRGGMGQVFRARDTRLDRDVALKILPELFASEPDRLMRFEREAKALASLNHPNIAAIYGIEDRAIVMELVEGRDLSEVILGARGLQPPGVPGAQAPGLRTNVPLDEAIAIARQIAEALEAAHEAGIIHRDLKPANIKVRDDGTVKVLDFGLAKALSTEHGAPGTAPGAPSTEHSALTVTSPALTAIGLILGTAAYMSPEQAKGRPVDRRADIWAFGVVLYEMVTGRRLFAAETVSESIAAVLRADIDLSALPASTPSAIRRLLTRCLDRDPKNRLQHIGEARIILSTPSAADSDTTQRSAWSQRPVVVTGAAVVLVVVGALAAAVLQPRPAPTPLQTTRFELRVNATAYVWSDDGRQLAWLERVGGTDSARMFLHRLDEFEIRELEIGEGRRLRLAFSPDGEWLAYTHAPVDSPAWVTEVRRVRVTGGASERIATVAVSGRAQLIWRDDRVYLTSDRDLLAVPATGGSLLSVVSLPEGLRFDGGLQFLNGGRDLLFVGNFGAGELWTMPMTGGEPRRVLDRVHSFRVTSTGHLVYTYVGETHLLGRRFREDTVEVIGDPVPLLELSFRGLHATALSPNGMLAYPVWERQEHEPVWLDRETGRVDVIHAGLPSSFDYRLSPDGQFLVYQEESRTGEARALRVWDIARQRGFMVTDEVSRFEIAGQTQTIFFQTFSVSPSLQSHLFRVDFPWTAVPTQLPLAELSERFLASVFPDGQRLVLNLPNLRGSLIVNANGSGTPVPTDLSAMPSPDGRWLAYWVVRGPRSEMWVRAEPAGPDARWLLAETGSVREAFWSSDGREVFYADEQRQWYSITVRDARSDSPFNLGRPAPVTVPVGVTPRGVTRDGKRFLAIRESGQSLDRLAIVVNFFEELRAKVPVK